MSAGSTLDRLLHIYPPSGEPDRTSLDPAHANELAAAIAAKINSVRREHHASSTHLYLACPWPLATLLGWHLSSSGHLVMHEPDIDRGRYRAACALANPKLFLVLHPDHALLVQTGVNKRDTTSEGFKTGPKSG